MKKSTRNGMIAGLVIAAVVIAFCALQVAMFGKAITNPNMYDAAFKGATQMMVAPK